MNAARRFLFAVCVAALAGFFACGGPAPKGEAIRPVGKVFVIDAAPMAPGEVRFFHYGAEGKTVVFFVARTPEGGFKTAFDACVTCYPYKKGYESGEGCVVCVKCATKFELAELGAGKGNCIPIKIEHTLKDGRLVIDRSEVEAGARWF